MVWSSVSSTRYSAVTDVPLPHNWTGSIGRIRTLRTTAAFSFRLPLRFLLTGGNVNSCITVTYKPRLRLIFGYSKIPLLFRECKHSGAQVSLAPDGKKPLRTHGGKGDGSGNRVSQSRGERCSGTPRRFSKRARRARGGRRRPAVQGSVLTPHPAHARAPAHARGIFAPARRRRVHSQESRWLGCGNSA